ncbi:alpha-mannosidase [Paenibacillus sp.]|uniref:alpha-mannosidase n=1 Tax=Paenibacillus sp. TaxID=58172 RepID=UPI002D53D84A|nr:glycoside hydrolase family 38 C-terminal domain-containing protein [Paenibacillus sp.]HZG56006.1 glycoside hydrolase family 38 C-terminal domain-containing protein [Paenibacillus sp.]
MGKKTVHVISHTHWDREWYMPFEKFRMRLVELIDKTMELLERPEHEFRSFHLDGHVLLVDDYLEIRQEQEARLRRLVSAGKLRIGPWYVLQDAFLTSGEAQVRNLQLGIRRAEELGGSTDVGYFPDTFGNISQSAQLLRGFEIETAVFGRGINGVAADNRVQHGDAAGYPSELWWASPDGSRVLSVFLANWYHNGMELPTDPEAAAERARNTIANVEKYATTSQLLLMNGCDHQPVQADVGQAIRTLNEAAPAYRFVHSGFPEYFAALREDAQPWPTVTGELIGEHTDGWGTLVNTASSRLYLKQWNAKTQRELERWTEPFAAIAWRLGEAHPDAFVRHAWKLLLQNHPHDSICGCSVDEVHDEMVPRFMKALQIAESLTERSLASIAAKIDTSSRTAEARGVGGAPGETFPIVVFNPLAWERDDWVEAHVDVETDAELPLDAYALYGPGGAAVPFDWADLGLAHGFTLPDDRFRVAWKRRRYKLRFYASGVPALGHATFALAPAGDGAAAPRYEAACVVSGDGTAYLENQYLRLDVDPFGTAFLLDKATGRTYADLLRLEDTGDIGNEYVYVKARDSQPIVTGDRPASLEVVASPAGAPALRIRHAMEVPVGLIPEGKYRSKTMHTQIVDVYVSLPTGSRRVDVEVRLDNRTKDHRLRALLPTDLDTPHVYADAPFDVVRRDIAPTERWTNPSRCERMQSFFDVSDGERGVTIVADGLPEYEVLRDGRNTMALTLLRCVGEMGDWNYFPTPGAQCLGPFAARFAIVPHAGGYANALREAYAFLTPMRAVAAGVHGGALAPETSWLRVEPASTAVHLSSLRKADTFDGVTARFVNLGGGEQPLLASGAIFADGARAAETLLNERFQGPAPMREDGAPGVAATLPGKKMYTVAVY